MAIKDWPANERPREKLINRGSHALSDAELLAIFLRTGCAGKSAVDLARDLLINFGSLRALLEADIKQFCNAHGLGPAKFVQLQAVLEMSRRHLGEALTKQHAFNSSSDVKNYLLTQIAHLKHEVFFVLFLDNQHALIKGLEMFRGTIDSAAVYPREIVKTALIHNAAAVVLAHNHPSGVSEPSDCDKAITIKIKHALDLVDIRTLDHLIVADREVLSFAEHGLL